MVRMKDLKYARRDYEWAHKIVVVLRCLSIDNKPKVFPTAITKLSENVESRTDHGWPDTLYASNSQIAFSFGCYETSLYDAG